MVQQPDTTLMLTVRSSGFYLVYRKIFKPDYPVVIDIGKIHLKKNGQYMDGSMSTQDLTHTIQQQLPSAERLVGIAPAYIRFQFGSAFSKKVPVIPNLKITYKQQYGLYERIRLMPDSVIITGPTKLVENIHSVTTPEYVAENLDETKEFTLPIIIEQRGLNVEPSAKNIKITIPVEQFTEETINVAVKCDSLPRSYSLNIYPPIVEVTFRVAVPDYEKVQPNMFHASISGPKALQPGNTKLKVRLTEFPSFIKVIGIHPEKVEYILNK